MESHCRRFLYLRLFLFQAASPSKICLLSITLQNALKLSVILVEPIPLLTQSIQSLRMTGSTCTATASCLSRAVQAQCRRSKPIWRCSLVEPSTGSNGSTSSALSSTTPKRTRERNWRSSNVTFKATAIDYYGWDISLCSCSQTT